MPKTIRRIYSREEKARLVAEIARRYQAGGRTYTAISRELGIAESSYHNWLAQGIKPAALEPAAPPAPVGPRTHSKAERERLLAEIASLRATGSSLEVACKAVGISDSSYRKWKAAAAPTPAMRPVEITALVPAAPTALAIASPRPATAGANASLTLSAPGGYEVKGLNVESAAALLKALA